MPLRIRDEGLVPPGAAVLLGPVCDIRFEEYESFERLAPTGIVYDAVLMGFARGAYVRYRDWSNPYVSPVRRDLPRLPTDIHSHRDRRPVA